MNILILIISLGTLLHKIAYALIINYGTDPDKVIAEINNVTMQVVPINAGAAPIPPEIKDIRISKTISNASSKIDYSLFGNAANFTNCKIFESSLITAFDYIAIDKIFTTGSDACPNDILSGNQGNWNTYNNSDKYVIWQNSDPDAIFSSYTLLFIAKVL